MRHNPRVSITEERRLVTALFVDLVGFTSRSEATDPEEMREIQRAYFEAATAQVERYGGRVEKYIGDAVMALFGAPQAHDDDAARALHAALAIREAVSAQDLEIRIGVNTGEVVGGAGAGAQANEYTVTGDAVNVAARLQQSAAPGEIYVGAATCRLAADAFEFAPLAPLEVKGKAEPMQAWRLARAAVEPRLARGGEAPLVGRSREQRLLEDALNEAAAGRGLIVGLAGEAGIGKSRLAVETRARADALGFGTAWASAPSYSTSFPYHLVGQLVERLEIGRDDLTRLAPDAETGALWSATLADLAGGASAEDATRLRDASPARRQRLLVQALGAVLVARSLDRPQLLVLDDVHWADASSIAVLDELLTLVPDHAIVVLALYRPGWENPWSGRSAYQQVNLGRLREDDALVLLQAMSPNRTLGETEATELLHRSGGNPFFLEELIRSQPVDGADGARRLPETVHELLLARIDALRLPARTTLQVATVAGTHFSEQLLAAIEPEVEADAALAELSRADLIVPTGGTAVDRGFGIRHPLVHEVAYRSMLVARRRELHRRIGAWLEAHGGDEALAEVARHYREGADLERARELLPRAAERAASVHARHEAIEAFLQAAELLDDDPARRAEMLERAAAQCFLLARLDEAIRHIGEARTLYERAGQERRALNARRLLGRYYWLEGRGAPAAAETDAAIAGLERLPQSAELALAYSYRSQLAFLAPEYDLGERLARRAIEVAEAVGSVEALAHALNNLGMCRSGLGDPGGVDDVRRSLALALEHNLVDDAARAYTNLSGQGTAIGFFPLAEAEALYDEMLAFDQRTVPGGGSYEQWHFAGRAEMWIATGRWDDAERLLRWMEPIVANANRYISLDVAAFLSILLSYHGRYEEAAAVIGPHVEVAVEIGDLQAYGPAFVAAAHAQRGQGNAPAAVEAIERGIRIRGETVEQNISTWLLFELTDVTTWLVRDGGVDSPLVQRALVALESLGGHLSTHSHLGGTPFELQVRRALRDAATAQGRILRGEPPDELAPLLRTAADALRGAHRVFEAARSELWLAEATGDEFARHAARSTFEEFPAPPYLQRADR